MVEDGYEVRVLKLVTGEEVLAFVDVSAIGYVMLKHPYSLVVTPDGKIAVIPFMIYANMADGVKLNRSHIMMVVTPKKDLIDNYLASMSNILTPNKQLIV